MLDAQHTLIRRDDTKEVWGAGGGRQCGRLQFFGEILFTMFTPKSRIYNSFLRPLHTKLTINVKDVFFFRSIPESLAAAFIHGNRKAHGSRLGLGLGLGFGLTLTLTIPASNNYPSVY